MNRTPQVACKRNTASRLRQPHFWIEFNADGIHGKAGAGHECVGFLIRAETVNLEFHLIPVWICVVHRYGDAVVYTPIRFDIPSLELFVIFEQIRNG